MRQFKTWTDNLEKDPVKYTEEKIVIQRVEYRNLDRVEKSIQCTSFVTQQKVTKDFKVRAEAKPFGIGVSFDDLKTNAAICTVQRENVWHPYYEVNLEEMDFKEKMLQAAEEKKMANVGGVAMTELQKQLQAHDEGVRLSDQEKKRAELGLTPKKVFNLQDKLRLMKKRDEEENEKPVVDPYTVKIRKLNNEVTERDLLELLAQFGEIVRVKIPMDEERGTNKGIGFVTFKS